MSTVATSPAAYLDSLNDEQQLKLSADFAEHLADEIGSWCMDYPTVDIAPCMTARRDAEIGRKVRSAWAKFVERKAEQAARSIL